MIFHTLIDKETKIKIQCQLILSFHLRTEIIIRPHVYMVEKITLKTNMKS